jgi:hypothetical protein
MTLRDIHERIQDLRSQLFTESGRLQVDNDKAIALRAEIGKLTQQARQLQAEGNR